MERIGGWKWGGLGGIFHNIFNNTTWIQPEYSIEIFAEIENSEGIKSRFLRFFSKWIWVFATNSVFFNPYIFTTLWYKS